ncbi:MAG: hypothetical protein K2I87_02465, partial [Bacteroidales bacterium]|nr:hypothetical protein [Bacteroidales bacterium]
MRTVKDQGCPVLIGCGSLEKLQAFLRCQAKTHKIVLLHEQKAASLILPPLFKSVPFLQGVPR